MADVRQAAYCGTRNLYGDMETAAKSLIANSSVEVVYMLCEDADMGRDLPDIIQVRDVHQQRFFNADGPNMRSCFSYMAMMRVTLSYVLQNQCRKVLSLDADTICLSNVDGIWDLPMDGCYFAAVPEWHKSGNGLLYCNHGVVLYDLYKMYGAKTDEIIRILNHRRFTWVEQDVCNYLCQGYIYEMPSKYNSCWWTDKNADGAVIRHYAGMKRESWIDRLEVVRWRNASWDEVLALHDEHVATYGSVGP